MCHTYFLQQIILNGNTIASEATECLACTKGHKIYYAIDWPAMFDFRQMHYLPVLVLFMSIYKLQFMTFGVSRKGRCIIYRLSIQAAVVRHNLIERPGRGSRVFGLADCKV